MVDIAVNRLSNSVDIIPLMVSERLVDVTEDYRGMIIEATGQFRSYNRHEGIKNRLVLSVFVREIEVIDAVDDKEIKTPLGREIADILIAVNRPYGKSDYIPCIAWGRNARYAAGFKIGEHIRIWGRVQSREYTKKLDEDTQIKRTAYEVSVSKIECVDEDDEQE